MRKFKLIKEYPGSPKLGSIWDDNSPNCAKYPEFWQEIVEKDYEILSLARVCSIKPAITDVSNYNDEFIEALLKCDNARIHSIKRKSDGEVFTIGDKVVHNFCKEAKIEKIYFIEPNRLAIYISKGWNSSIYNIEHIKQPLFTTEDGVDIFEGDIYYFINKNLKGRINNLIARKGSSRTESDQKEFLYFSTEASAEEYILMNKPCLSINDINKLKVLTFSNWDKYLKELVKTRL